MLSMTTEKKLRLSNNPNGLAWSKDENKFGQKLMEKMGWTKGKGLGANEDGMTEHVKVSLKSDKKGVGCTQEHTNKWLDLQDDYEAILATMNASNSSTSSNNCLSQDDNKKDFISLVQKSQNTKSRVHYSRFAGGKDLSTKAEKDLDCVFGTKAKREDKTASRKPEEPATDVDNNTQKAEFGVLTTTSATSVRDYFTQKMAAMKLGKNMTKKSEESSASKVSEKTEFGVTTTTGATSVQDYFAQKMATMRRAKSDTHLTEMCHKTGEVINTKFFDDTNLPTVVHIEEEVVSEKVSGKKSKKKKRKKEEEEGSSNVKFIVDESETLPTEESKEMSRKNEESYKEAKETQENPSEQERSSTRKTRKEKRKREKDEGKINLCEIENTYCVKPKMEEKNQETLIVANNDSTHILSYKKRKQSKEVEDKQDVPCETEDNECVRVKKRKRSKEVEEEQEASCKTENSDCIRTKKRKRSRKV